MQEIITKLYDKIDESVSSCESKCLSLSGGLDSSILAYHLRDKKPQAISVISQDFIASDLTYCQLIANTFDFPLEMKTATTEMILDSVEKTIKILKNFNDIEIRNQCVMYIVLNASKELGYDKIITGDGADELFAGYSFLQKKSQKDLEDDLKRIWNVMHFPTIELGKSLRIKVESPFLNPKVVEFAKTIPTSLKVKNENQKTFGKWILRKAYEEKIPKSIAWREKAPMQDGAGTVGLTNLFESIIPDNIFEEKKKSIKESDGVIIRTKESLHYYQLYRKYFEIPSKLHTTATNCPYCHYSVENDSKFCRMCGSFPI